LVVGVIGGQMSARLGRVSPVSTDAALTAPSPAAAESAKEIAAISKHDAEDSDGVRVFGLDPGVVLASYREPQTSGGR
jgi:hypothetical protein